MLATLTAATTALDGIVAPSEVEAGNEIEVTFQHSNDDQYRVYLAASLAGSNGPTCKKRSYQRHLTVPDQLQAT